MQEGSEERGFHPTKRLGQNFLKDPNLARKIVEALEPSPKGAALEVGPGFGALTGILLERFGRVVAIEKDPHCAEALRERFAGDDRFILIEGDCRDVDPAPYLVGWSVCAVSNLPYSQTTTILRWLLTLKQPLERIVVTMQKEVAQRACASPGCKAFGRLTVLVGLWGKAKRVFDIGPKAFRPRPKVMSSAVLIVPREARALEEDEVVAVERITRAAFGQRRKKVGKALSEGLCLPRPAVDAVLTALGVPEGARAEDLDPATYRLLATRLLEMA